jgi:hypothetical protein
MKQLVTGLFFRHILTAVGASAVTSGIMSDVQWQAIAGGLAAGTSVVLSYFNKKRLAGK